MDEKEIYKILRYGSSEDREKLINFAPAHEMKGLSLDLVKSGMPGMVVLAVTNLSVAYCNGKAPEFGAKLAFAAHKMAVELYENEPDHAGLIKTTLSNLAFQYVNALNLLGNSQEVDTFTEEWITYYQKKVQEPENLSSLLTARANALINLNRIDEAQAILDDNTIYWNPGNQIERKRLLNKINMSKAPVTSVVKPEPIDMNKVIADALQEMVGSMPNQTDSYSQLSDLLVSNSGKIDVNDKTQYEKTLEALKKAETFLTKGTTGENEWTIKQKVREATKIFKIFDKPEKTAIQNSMLVLQDALGWAKKNQHNELINDSLWGIYLCYSRLGDNSKAADALILLRTNLENMRAGIQDPLERGGAFSTYQYLFNSMVEKLYSSGRNFDLLQAIESSKGRAIADLLTKQFRTIMRDVDTYSAASDLPKLTQQHNFHYLTFFLDELEQHYIAYAVLVDKNGQIRSIEPAKIQRETFLNAVKHLDPSQWDQPSFDNPGILPPNASINLEPLTQWVKPLMDAQILKYGDHLVISGDGHLCNIPWHYLLCDGKFLLDLISTSRVHNASHLKLILNYPLKVPNTVLGVVLPRARDLKKPNWKQFRENLYKPIYYLKEFFPESNVECLENTRVTLSSLSSKSLKGKLVHFSTHGFFPSLDAGGSPYHSSGILLSDGKKLPTDRQSVSKECLLTPEKLLKNEINLTGSHISLMACVSGLSKEGIGGDALGLDWALIQAGASSMLSSHWDVDASDAAEFFQLFYDNWLIKQESRAKAVRNAMIKMKQKSNPHAWAAFCLSGDWR